MEKVKIEIGKQTLVKLKEMIDMLDFDGEVATYDEIILSMLKYINNKYKKVDF